MASRPIQLRWHGRCRLCSAELRAHDTAWFDDVSRHLTCLDCREAAPEPPTRRLARERQEVRSLIAETRAVLDAAHHAS